MILLALRVASIISYQPSSKPVIARTPIAFTQTYTGRM